MNNKKMNGSTTHEPPKHEAVGGLPCDVLAMLSKLNVPCDAMSQIAQHAAPKCPVAPSCEVLPEK